MFGAVKNIFLVSTYKGMSKGNVDRDIYRTHLSVHDVKAVVSSRLSCGRSLLLGLRLGMQVEGSQEHWRKAQ